MKEMDFENRHTTPQWITLFGWIISLIAFALGFYHTGEGLRFFKPLGFEGGSFLVSALISMLLLIAYYRAVSGFKGAIFFYVLCAVFNFVFNVNSFYPSLNGDKLLKEEAKIISDTINYNISLQSYIGNQASLQSLANLENFKNQCIAEIKYSNGYSTNAKNALQSFNAEAAKYGMKPIKEGSFSVSNPNAASILNSLMTSTLNTISNGIALDSSKTAAYFKFQDLKNIKTNADGIFQEIDESSLKFNEDTLKWKMFIDSLKHFVRINDEVSTSINNMKLNQNNNQGQIIPLRFHVLNPSTKDELLIPQTEYLGHFNHTINSMIKRINKLDTWGVIILVFFIDFMVPIAVYFLIRKDFNVGKSYENTDKPSFIEKILGFKKPERF
jgi:hypothetical protein